MNNKAFMNLLITSIRRHLILLLIWMRLWENRAFKRLVCNLRIENNKVIKLKSLYILTYFDIYFYKMETKWWQHHLSDGDTSHKNFIIYKTVKNRDRREFNLNYPYNSSYSYFLQSNSPNTNDRLSLLILNQPNSTLSKIHYSYNFSFQHLNIFSFRACNSLDVLRDTISI